MNQETLTRIIDARISKIRSTLKAKQGQYAREDDRLHNFKKIAGFRGVEPEEALMGLVVKHIVALDDFINDLPGQVMSMSQWDEKIGDIINYMILLEALIQERMQGCNVTESEVAGPPITPFREMPSTW